MTDKSTYVPLSIRSQSRIVTWLWVHAPASWTPYNRARWLAKRLP